MLSRTGNKGLLTETGRTSLAEANRLGILVRQQVLAVLGNGRWRVLRGVHFVDGVFSGIQKRGVVSKGWTGMTCGK